MLFQSVTSEFVMIPHLLASGGGGGSSPSSSLNSSFTLPSLTCSDQQLILSTAAHAAAAADSAHHTTLQPDCPRPVSPLVRPTTAFGSRSFESFSSGSLHASDLSSSPHASDLSSSLHAIADRALSVAGQRSQSQGVIGQGSVECGSADECLVASSVGDLSESSGGDLSESQSSISTHYGSLPDISTLTKKKKLVLAFDTSQSLVDLMQSWTSLQRQVCRCVCLCVRVGLPLAAVHLSIQTTFLLECLAI